MNNHNPETYVTATVWNAVSSYSEPINYALGLNVTAPPAYILFSSEHFFEVYSVGDFVEREESLDVAEIQRLRAIYSGFEDEDLALAHMGSDRFYTILDAEDVD